MKNYSANYTNINTANITVFAGSYANQRKETSVLIPRKSDIGGLILRKRMSSYKTKTHTLISRANLKNVIEEIEFSIVIQQTLERLGMSHDYATESLEDLRGLMAENPIVTAFKIKRH